MHLVFLNQYYPPDVAPTGVMLEAVVKHLVAEGHDVTVICADGGYADGHGSPCYDSLPANVIRIRATRFGRGSFIAKLLDYISYYWGAAWYLLMLKRRPDRVVALTTPPYLSLLARLMSKCRGADHAHWVMDVYPDVMVAHGMLQEEGIGHRLLSALASWGMGGRRCAALLTLGPDMADRIRSLCHQFGDQSRIRWVPLWSGAPDAAIDESENLAHELRQARGWHDHDFIVMYSGNMGLGHRFTELLEVILRMANGVHGSDRASSTPVKFVFFGGGKRRNEIAEWSERHPDCAVELHDYVSSTLLTEHLRSADLHFVSLEPSWTGTMLPSKLQGIFESARPVVFLGNEESSLAQWIIESGGGWVVRPDDVDGLQAAIMHAMSEGEGDKRGADAHAFAQEHFDRQKNVSALGFFFAGRPGH